MVCCNRTVSNILPQHQPGTNTKYHDHDQFDSHDHDHDHNDNDADHFDSNQVENTLTQELLKLSFEDRKDNQEEIHGVKCLAPKETPEFIELSLQCLIVELERQSNVNNNNNTTATATATATATTSASSATINVDETSSSYKIAYLQSQSFQEGRNFVNSKEFRLRFLRLELFDSKMAAISIMKFLHGATQLFGSLALWRPITLSDFTSQEKKDFRKARFQLLPQRANGTGTGRLVLCLIPDETYIQIPIQTKNKILLYITWVIGSDVNTQRRGVVVIVLFDLNSFSNLVMAIHNFRNSVLNPHIFSVRGSGVHFCTPDTSFYRLIRSLLIAKVVTRDVDRSRVQLHTGTAIELRYILQGYGKYMYCM